MVGPFPIEHRRSWNPDVAGITEVVHASFTEHTYPRHCHDTWTVLLIDDGAVNYDLDRRSRAATVERVTILPPFVAHDGRTAQPGRSFRKRVLHVDASLFDDCLVGAAVDRSAIEKPDLRAAVSRLHRRLDRETPGSDDLELESSLALVVDAISTTLAGIDEPTDSTRSHRAVSEAAEALKATLDIRFRERLDLTDLAGELGWQTTHLVRSFSSRFGLPPHRYVISRRIDAARGLLLDGWPPSATAVEVGFHDQAHLSRHFKAHLGVTPGRFQRNH